MTPYRGRQEIESLRQLLVVKDEETPKVVFAFVPTRPLPVGDEWPKEVIKMGLSNIESMDMEMFVRMDALDEAAKGEVRRSLGLPPRRSRGRCASA